MKTITRAVKTKSAKPPKHAVRATATAGPSSGYLSTIAAAKLCGVSVFSVQRWFDEGILAGARLPGGRRRIDAKSLDAATKARQSISTDIETIGKQALPKAFAAIHIMVSHDGKRFAMLSKS